MTLFAQDRSPLGVAAGEVTASVGDAKAHSSLAAVPSYLRDLCLELPTSDKPTNIEGLSRGELLVLGDYAQSFLDRRAPVESLDSHLLQTYRGGTANSAKAALVRRGLLAISKGVLPTRAGMEALWDEKNGSARSRLADHGRNLFVAPDFSYVLTPATSALLRVLAERGKDGVAFLHEIAQDLGVGDVGSVIDVVRKLHTAGRVRVRPAGPHGDWQVVDLSVEARSAVGDTSRIKSLQQPKVAKERAKPKAVMSPDPAALITKLVREAGSEGISIREIRARLEGVLPQPQLNNKQLFGFLNKKENGFVGVRLDRRMPDGTLVLYRIASASAEAK